MNDFKRVGALCLVGLSVVLVVGGSAFFGSGLDDMEPGAAPGNPVFFVRRVLADTGFWPMMGIAVLLLLTALFVYPWRLPPEGPDSVARPPAPDVWPPAPLGPAVETPKQPAHHWARPDFEED